MVHPLIRFSPHLATAGTFLLLVYVGMQSYQSLRALGVEGGLHTAAPGAATADGLAQDRADLSQLAQWHLFGSTKKAPRPAPQSSPQEAPKTKLTLNLQGIVYIPNSDKSLAIISDPQRRDRPYRIGDRLPGDVTLHSVEAGRVILSGADGYESLILTQDKIDLQKTARAEPETRSVAPPAVTQQAATGSMADILAAPATRAGYETMLEDYKKKMADGGKTSRQELLEYRKQLIEYRQRLNQKD